MQFFFPRESKLLKAPMPSFINLMNKDVLELHFSIEHNLQVHNLSLYSLRSSNLDLVNFYLCLSTYLFAQFLSN